MPLLHTSRLATGAPARGGRGGDGEPDRPRPHDARTPANTAWLLAGAVALGSFALTLTTRALADAERLVAVYRPVNVAIAVAAGAAVLTGGVRPASWLLALLLVAILSGLWFFAVNAFSALAPGAKRRGTPDDRQPCRTSHDSERRSRI